MQTPGNNGSALELDDWAAEDEQTMEITVPWSHYDEPERMAILAVLRRDALLRAQELERIRRLKAELQQLKRKGALKAHVEDDGRPPASSSSTRSCGRCRVEFGRIINRGAACRTCKQRVCKNCREFNLRGTEWVCTLCFKNAELQAATSEWMNVFVRRPSRRRNSKDYVAPGDIVAKSIKRCWTISNPSGSKGNREPELRAYNTLSHPHQPKAASPPSGASRQFPYSSLSQNDVVDAPALREAHHHPRLAPRRSASLSQADAVTMDRSQSQLHYQQQYDFPTSTPSPTSPLPWTGHSHWSPGRLPAPERMSPRRRNSTASESMELHYSQRSKSMDRVTYYQNNYPTPRPVAYSVDVPPSDYVMFLDRETVPVPVFRDSDDPHLYHAGNEIPYRERARSMDRSTNLNSSSKIRMGTRSSGSGLGPPPPRFTDAHGHRNTRNAEQLDGTSLLSNYPRMGPAIKPRGGGGGNYLTGSLDRLMMPDGGRKSQQQRINDQQRQQNINRVYIDGADDAGMAPILHSGATSSYRTLPGNTTSGISVHMTHQTLPKPVRTNSSTNSKSGPPPITALTTPTVLPSSPVTRRQSEGRDFFPESAATLPRVSKKLLPSVPNSAVGTITKVYLKNSPLAQKPSPPSSSASSWTSYDVEQATGTVFRKVTLTKERERQQGHITFTGFHSEEDVYTSSRIHRSHSRRTQDRTTYTVRESSLHEGSDSASEEIVLDTEKMVPGGDDYRLVFISSDSSKSSLDEEGSFEDDTSRRPSSGLPNESDTAGFIDETDWEEDLHHKPLPPGHRQRRLLSSPSSSSSVAGTSIFPPKKSSRSLPQPPPVKLVDSASSTTSSSSIRTSQKAHRRRSSSALEGSWASSWENNSPRTFLIDDFHQYAWSDSSALPPEPQAILPSVPQVTTITREVQTDPLGSLDEQDFHFFVPDIQGGHLNRLNHGPWLSLSTENINPASPTRSLEEWETASHHIRTPSSLGYRFSLAEDVPGTYLPIWQPPLSRRSSLQSLSHMYPENWCPSEDSQDPGSEDRLPRPFYRSDSKRSSGERSLEELQLSAEHMLASSALVSDSSAFLSSLYSAQGTALPGLHEYRNQILHEIQAYTSKGDWNLCDKLSQPDNDSLPTANKAPLPNQNTLEHSVPNAPTWHNWPKPSPLRFRNPNPSYRIWPTGLPSARSAVNSAKRWKPCSVLMETEPFLWEGEPGKTPGVSGPSARWPSEALLPEEKERKSGALPVASPLPRAASSSENDLLTTPSSGQVVVAAVERELVQVGGDNFWEKVPFVPQLVGDSLPASDVVGKLLENSEQAVIGVKELAPVELLPHSYSDSDLQLLPEKLVSDDGPTFSCSNYDDGKANDSTQLAHLPANHSNTLPSACAAWPTALQKNPFAPCSGDLEQEARAGNIHDENAARITTPIIRSSSSSSTSSHSCPGLVEPAIVPSYGVARTETETQNPTLVDPEAEQVQHPLNRSSSQTCETSSHIVDSVPVLPDNLPANNSQELGEIEERDEPNSLTNKPEVNSDCLSPRPEMEDVSDNLATVSLDGVVLDDNKSEPAAREEKGETPHRNSTIKGEELIGDIDCHAEPLLPASASLSPDAEGKETQTDAPDSVPEDPAPQDESPAPLPAIQVEDLEPSGSDSVITDSEGSRFQVTRASTPEVRENRREPTVNNKARRLPSDSEGVTSGDDESPGFETDSQQNTVVEGQGQYQNLRYFALKQSRSSSQMNQQQSWSEPEGSHSNNSSIPASPVLSDGRLTPQRRAYGGQYTSYILITQDLEKSSGKEPEEAVQEDLPVPLTAASEGKEETVEKAPNRVTVTVPAPAVQDHAGSVCVVAVSAVEEENSVAEDDLTLRFDQEGQQETQQRLSGDEDEGSYVTVSGNGTLTEFGATDDDKDSDDFESSSRLSTSEFEEDLGDEDPLTTSNLARYFTLTLETGLNTPRKQPVTHRNPIISNDSPPSLEEESTSTVPAGEEDSFHEDSDPSERYGSVEDVESNYSESASSGDEAYLDREEELRGYHRAIDFTLHTILEESCEESDGERRKPAQETERSDPSALEKYFTMGLAAEESAKAGPQDSCSRRRGSASGFANEESEYSDTFSETSSSIYSEALDSVEENDSSGLPALDPVDLASSRLEKYFLTGFLGLEAGQYHAAGIVNPEGALNEPGNGSDGGPSSDGSESVGSDSEGHPSPEQRRRKVIKARGARPANTFAHHSHLLFPDWPPPRTGTSKDRGTSSENLTLATVAHSPSLVIDTAASQETLPALSSSENDQKDKNEGDLADKAFEKADGQFDTIKRRKKTKRSVTDPSTPVHDRADSSFSETPAEDKAAAGPIVVHPEIAVVTHELVALQDEDTLDTPPTEEQDHEDSPELSQKYQSRDSGFIGSCDDLLTENSANRTPTTPPSSGSDELDAHASQSAADLEILAGGHSDTADTKSTKSIDSTGSSTGKGSLFPSSRSAHLAGNARSHSAKVTRKDSFNNWSSDEETNLMMNKMRAFFRNMIQSAPVAQPPAITPPPPPLPPILIHSTGSDASHRIKPPQLVAFENELTRLMKTVPGINDEQVKEIVEYLSSEDTWSDSYDSSDYTSSDLEGAYYAAALESTTVPDLQLNLHLKSHLQEQISASCQEIIEQFDVTQQQPPPESLQPADNLRPEDPANSLTKETALVYQRLMSSLIRTQQHPKSPQLLPSHVAAPPHNSPPLIAKVLQHIGNRLVALMHEVSNSDSHSGSLDERHHSNVVTSSPRLRKLIPRSSSSSLTGPNHPQSISSADSGSTDEKSSLHSTSFDSNESPTETEQSPDSSDDRLAPPSSSNKKKSRGLHSTRSLPNASTEPKLSSLPLLFGSEHRLMREEIRGYSSLESSTQTNRSGSSLPYQPRYKSRTADKNRSPAPEPVVVAAPLPEDDKNEDHDESEERFVKKARALPRFSVFRSSRESREALQSSSSGISDIAEERDEFSGWRSSFESAIAADSRTKLSLEAKRRSAGSGGSSSELFASMSSDHLLLERESQHIGIGSRMRSRPGGHSSKFSLPNLLERDAVRLAKERERERERSASSDVLLSTSPVASHSLLGVIDQREEEDADWDLLRSTRLSTRRRSSVPDTRCEERRVNDRSPEPRSTTLPRTVTGFSVANGGSTGSIMNLPVSVSSSHTELRKPLAVLSPGTNSASTSSLNTTSASSNHADTPIRSARYRPPGYRHQPVPQSSRFTQRVPSAPGLGPSQGLPWSGSLTSRKHVRSMFTDDHNDANSTPPFVREGLRTSIASAASGESFSSISGTETTDDVDHNVAKHRSTSLSALGTRSDSLASVYSAAGEARYGTVTVKGEVQFALFYNYRHSELQVLVKQCRDLAPVDVKRSRSDPYVKVYLLPDRSKSGKRKTKVKKHTLSPLFDENLKFPTTLNELDARTLWLTVWHSDMFGRNDFLGEVLMPLAGKIFDDTTPRWFPLQERTEPLEDSLITPLTHGDIIVALKYLPPEVLTTKKGRKSKGALHILVKEAKGLVPVRSSGLADPICKCCIIPEKGKQSKQKTSVSRRSLNPAWNHTFIYEAISLEELKERSIELTIWDHDRLGSKDFMGGVRFNSGLGEYQGKAVDWADANGNELTLWQNMLERPNLWFEGSVPLRAFRDKPQD